MNNKNEFNGFNPETVKFLKDIKSNNDKKWFEGHKQDYQQYLLKPLQRLVIDMSEFMLSIDPDFEVRPAINKTISTIYRDTRFAKDKSPLKSTMWITFKRQGKDWKDAPCYFFEITPEPYRYGMGFYSASNGTMEKLRNAIDAKSKKFLNIISLYKKQQNFIIDGEKYKRIFDKNKSEEEQNWYQRKNLYFVCNKTIDKHLFSKKLLDDLMLTFKQLSPFYHFLREMRS
ncbi:DUF2461 domain-containing protein [Candidatus Desantisbacteria bacterium]|nr:DUF2461 domain-containing protein [Candidatus Desantisbacteria bacterium]